MRLPTFIIAGERRCGTTALDRWLNAHPDVYLHPHRDMAYFIERELVGTLAWRDGEADAEAWEREHSREDYAALFAAAGACRAVGEKSADLLFWRPAHARIAAFVPRVKLIVTLRDPIERAWSHYWNEVGKGRETLGFDAALGAEAARSERSAYARNHLSYLARGDYASSLEHLFRHVDRERVHVRTLEEAARAPQEDLVAIYRFLGVDPARGLEHAGTKHNRNRTLTRRAWAERPPFAALERAWTRLSEAAIVRLFRDTARRNAARKLAKRIFYRPASGVAMPAATRRRLRAHFAPATARLETLLGRPIPAWRD